MEGVDEKRKIEKKSKNRSNLCVIDLPFDKDNENEEFWDIEKKGIDNTTSLNKSFDDKLNFKKKLNLIDNFENILDLGEEEDIMEGNEHNNSMRKTRSKTFKIKSSNKNCPKPKPIITKEYIKIFRLNSNNSIISENSQKDLIECKSCDDKNDDQNKYMNYFNYKDDDTDEEIKNTLKINKIEGIKKLFDNKINYKKNYNEYENVLNIEKIFLKNVNNLNENLIIIKNRNMQNYKNRKFWRKHINVFKKQLKTGKSLEEKNDNEFRIKRSDTFSKKNYEGLFLLGVLESAAKEKKRRKTIHSNKIIKHIPKDEDEK